MMTLRYKGDIDQFLLEIDNWNVKVKVTGVVLRKMIQDQIPEDAVRRLCMCYWGSNILKTIEYTRPVRLGVWRIRLGRQDDRG